MTEVWSRRAIVAACGVGLVVLATLSALAFSGGSANALVQGQLVPETPRRDVPVVLDGRVLAHAKVGDRIFVGGDFQQVQLPNGTVITQPFLFAYDVDTGELDPAFRPEINKLVRSLAPTQAGDGLYVGGLFSTWDDDFPLRIAKLDAQGELITSFDARASARVQSIVEVGNSVYIGGDFTSVSGQPAQGLAKLDRTTGLVDTDFLPAFTNSINGSQLVRRVKSSPNGNALFVLHYAQSIDGQAREAVAKFDLGGAVPTLSTWNIPWTQQNPADNGGVSSTWPGAANSCDINDPAAAVNPSVLDPANAVFRRQMAALNPATGQALNWDPGSNNLVAVYDVTLIDRGLLAGHDSNRFNDFNVGRSGFFDFGNGADATPPELIATDPAPGAVTSNATQIAGTATDDREIASVTIRLKNITTNQFLQPNGIFASASADLPVTLTAVGLGQVAWSYPVANLPVGDYEIRGFATDSFGNTSSSLVSPFVVPGTTRCSVALNAADEPVITYSGFEANGVSNIFVRRDGKWLATVAAGSGSYTDATAAPGDYGYLVRWRPVGSSVDVTCAPSTITVPQGGGGVACSVGLDAASKPMLTWTPVDGVNRYSVREAAEGFIAVVTNGTTYTDAGASPGTYSYVIRYRQNGSTVNLGCTPSPITVPNPGGNGPTCTVSVNPAGNVEVNWTAIAGEDRYIVRDDDGFVATVDNATSYVDTNPTPGQRTYLIRYRMGGPNIDFTCAPDPLLVQ